MQATQINAIGVPWRASSELPEPAQNGSARILPAVPVAQRHTPDRRHLGTDPQSVRHACDLNTEAELTSAAAIGHMQASA